MASHGDAQPTIAVVLQPRNIQSAERHPGGIPHTASGHRTVWAASCEVGLLACVSSAGQFTGLHWTGKVVRRMCSDMSTLLVSSSQGCLQAYNRGGKWNRHVPQSERSGDGRPMCSLPGQRAVAQQLSRGGRGGCRPPGVRGINMSNRPKIYCGPHQIAGGQSSGFAWGPGSMPGACCHVFPVRWVGDRLNMWHAHGRSSTFPVCWLGDITDVLELCAHMLSLCLHVIEGSCDISCWFWYVCLSIRANCFCLTSTCVVKLFPRRSLSSSSPHLPSACMCTSSGCNGFPREETHGSMGGGRGRKRLCTFGLQSGK